MTTITGLARQYAEQYAEGVVPANLKAIRKSKTINLGLLGAAIGCTYWHQAHHLSDIDGFAMGPVNLGYVAPLIWDVAMLSNANMLQTPAMHRDAKRRAVVMMAVSGAVSMAVNLELTGLVAGAWAARILFAVLVALAVGQKWAGAAIRPDFKALEGLEVEAVVQATPEPAAVEVKRCPADCTCKRHPRNRKPVRKPRKPTHAPVSPAPGGQLVDGVWVPNQKTPANA